MWFNVKYLAMGLFYCIFDEVLLTPLTYSLPNGVYNASVILNKYYGLLNYTLYPKMANCKLLFNLNNSIFFIFFQG